MLYKSYYSAKSLAEAISILADPGGSIIKPISGGTDLILQLYQGSTHADALVDISKIPEMLDIRQDHDSVCVGASNTFRRILESELLRKSAYLLVEAGRKIGAAQIQNMGTIGGNIANASPAGDTIPCLFALEAKLTLSSRLGERTLPIDLFYHGYRSTDLKPDEVIREISFRRLSRGDGSAFVKYGLRQSQAISVVMVAAVLRVQEGLITKARVAIGSVAPAIVRSISAERVLLNQEPSQRIFESAGEAARADICPIDDVRGSAAFRRYLTMPLVKNALEVAWVRAQNVN